MALSRCGQARRVAPGSHEFPAAREAGVRDIVAFHGPRAGVVPSLRRRPELRHAGLPDDSANCLDLVTVRPVGAVAAEQLFV
jgi:hypothetical protein